jgi:hypothetical protein
MAKITEITASVGRTIQIEPYCPYNVHASIKADLTEGEDREKVYKKLYAEAKKAITVQLKEAKNAIDQKAQKKTSEIRSYQ